MDATTILFLLAIGLMVAMHLGGHGHGGHGGHGHGGHGDEREDAKRTSPATDAGRGDDPHAGHAHGGHPRAPA